jgi:hypothetical protein
MSPLFPLFTGKVLIIPGRTNGSRERAPDDANPE